MRLYLTLPFLALQLSAHAGVIPKYGAISKEEAEMKSCKFDKEANAMIMYHHGDVYFLDATTVQDIKIRVKFFNEKEIDKWSKAKIEFDTDQDETIENIEGSTYNMVNGKVMATELDKASIYTEKAVNGRMAKVFAMPAVKPGSVIEYTYRYKSRSSIEFPSWVFSHDIPCLISKYNSQIPQQLRIQHSLFTTLPVEKRINEGSGNTDMEFIMRNIPALPYEEFMGSRRDYLQRVQFELLEVNYSNNLRMASREFNWNNVYKTITKSFLSAYFYEHLNKIMAMNEGYYAGINKLSSKKERMIYIYNYVKSHMTWDHKSTFLSPRGIMHAWNKMTGSYGDINIALINLLREAEIDVSAVLTSTKEHGSVNPIYPSLSNFNIVVAEVKLDNESFILDASSKQTPYYLVSPHINNSAGYKLTKDSYEWISIFSDHSIKKTINVSADLSEQGIMSGDIQIRNTDYAKLESEESWYKGSEHFMASYIKGKPEMQIISCVAENLKSDSLPFIQQLKFNQTLLKSEPYSYFNLNFFDVFKQNPFSSDTRYADIDFDVLQRYKVQGAITIPDKYEIETLPLSQSLIMPDTSIVVNRWISHDVGVLSFKIDIEFKKTGFDREDYAILKDFYKKLFDMLNESILLKTKN